ncbi:MAG: 30S ribosomal protein S3 [Candidatus Sungbacteria bacterium]|uniref:Small ribosomal subunit protein uS3 n=2 Tax=Candidatus Sungiibacteriota bacterium TaxID=2750080 RepID=A0A931YD13_9BACT|nr:30S ribosomal protein S3 [Candidatus Sungbacteria bacterium]
MAHKINPIAFWLGIQKDWKSRWFNTKNLKAFLEEDFIIRKWLEEKLEKASLESIDIVRSGNSISIIIKSSRPGLIIGRGGKGLEELQQGLKHELNKIYVARKSKLNQSIKLEIEEIKKPESYARLVAKNIAEQLEKRIPHRRAMKQMIEKVSGEGGIKGIKIKAAGRLGGAEIARREQLSKGKIPLQNLRADIDYAQAEAHTTYGVIGVKVWLYKGDKFEEKKNL